MYNISLTMETIKAMFKKCFGSDHTYPERKWSKSQILLVVNNYELDYKIKDRKNGKVITCPIEEYDEKKHTVSFDKERYYKKLFEQV